MAYAFMASSSQKTPLEEEEKDRDWLELGLGFGAACGKPQHQEEEEEECVNVLPNPFPVPSVVSVPPSSALQLQAQRQTELGLGLGLGLGLNNDDHRVIDHHVAVPFSNYHRSWKNQDYHNDHDLASRPSLGGFPGLHDDWQLQVPNYLHDNHSTSGRCRPHPAGLWFSLQSYTNQKGEKLPQIPKAYIRVKNENLTVLMVKKYLVTKLGLSNEAEIEISCMGQKLLHTQTLKQVRDTVWLPKLVESVNSTSTIHHSSLHQQSSVNHLMSLHYARPCVSD